MNIQIQKKYKKYFRQFDEIYKKNRRLMRRTRLMETDLSLNELNGVLIISIPNAQPVLILKIFGEKFHTQHKKAKGLGQVVGQDFRVFWKGKKYGHNLPPVVKKKYGHFFDYLGRVVK